MYPQYQHRNLGGEIAIWLLLTVGALLIPIVIIAICCIRRHWLKRPRIKLMENRSLPMMTTLKQLEALRSYNGPYTESSNDDVLEKHLTPTSSLKKQHVHWPDGSTKGKTNNPYSMQTSGVNILNTTMLTESPSAHRRPLNSSLSHFIQSAIMPAGSTIDATGASQFLAPSKEFTSISIACN